jgi:hypothetical protein
MLTKPIVGVVCVFVLTLSGAAAAQTTTSPTVARELASLMSTNHIDVFAVQDPASKRFMASMLIPGVQLLVVSAEYPAPAELQAQIERKNYRDVYTALHQPVTAPTRFFVIDLACDGLSAKGDQVDILYEKEDTQTLFNGDWKGQGLAEADYRKRVEDGDRQYTRVLTNLRDVLKATAPGA